MTDRPSLQIDVWSDIECPWCYIGKHRLDAAIAASPHADAITVQLHSYQLEPDMAERPIANVDRVATKYGLSTAEAARMDGQAATIAHRDGLPFVADRILANSFDAHRVLQLADGYGLANPLLAALQHALFSGEANVFDHDVLIDLAEGIGIPRDRVGQVLAGDEYADAVRDDIDAARRLGVTGVPFTVLDGRIAIPGTTSVESFADIIEKAWNSR